MNKLELKCGNKVLFSTKINRLPNGGEELQALFMELARSVPADKIVDVESEILTKECKLEENEETSTCAEPQLATHQCE